MTRLLLLTGCFLALLTSAGCGSSTHANSPAQAQSTSSIATPRDLHSIDELRAAFNAHPGEPRLIVLVSPT